MASFLTDDVVLFDAPNGGKYMNWFPHNQQIHFLNITIWYWEKYERPGTLIVHNNGFMVAGFKIKDLHEALSRIRH